MCLGQIGNTLHDPNTGLAPTRTGEGLSLVVHRKSDGSLTERTLISLHFVERGQLKEHDPLVL